MSIFPLKISPPETSTTLLRDLASDTQHARWGEFVSRYRPMMDVYMREHFPTLEADEIIQWTLISLIRIFPVYHYCPDEKGKDRFTIRAQFAAPRRAKI